MAELTEAQYKLLADALDPDKVQIYCKDHMYFGPSSNNQNLTVKPKMNCPKCWFVYFLIDIGRTPPDQRYARLQELTEVVHHLCEAADKGTFDFEPYDRPHVEITRD
jgi:hypothetical protein